MNTGTEDLNQELSKPKLTAICSNCKKIRDINGNWIFEPSLDENSDNISFSHSLCPECTKNIYPDLEEY